MNVYIFIAFMALVAVVGALIVFFGLLWIGEYLCEWCRLKQIAFMIKSLLRNPVRAALSYLATFVLVFVISVIYSILAFLDRVQTEKSSNFKAIITDRYQIPSQMPFSYDGKITNEALSLPEDKRPSRKDLMTWQFVAATLDKQNRTFQNTLFLFALEPDKLLTMMDDLDELVGSEREQLAQAVEAMKANPRGVILGRERLALLDKKVGDPIKAFSLNYNDIDFEFIIVGQFPEGRYNQSSAMHRDYLNRSLDDYKARMGIDHPMAEKTLNLYWIRLADKDGFQMLAETIEAPGRFSSPPVKMETASSGISTFLEAWKDLIWGMRWLLMPAILVTMSLVIANAISISVRERRTEMAVLKVLGFRPNQILILVLGEAVLIGALSGFLSVLFTYLIVNLQGGFKFPIAFFPSFLIPSSVLYLGPLIGALTAFAGTIGPAWSARSVKVSQVFARVA